MAGFRGEVFRGRRKVFGKGRVVTFEVRSIQAPDLEGALWNTLREEEKSGVDVFVRIHTARGWASLGDITLTGEDA